MTAAVASAKVILLGEHAVVEGTPALVAGLPTGMEARVTGPAPALTVSVDPWDLTASAMDREGLAGRALAALDEALAAVGLSEAVRNVRVHVQAAIPAGVGLGSSAALAVVVSRAVALAADRLDLVADQMAAELADASERVFHGRPSGVDAAVAAGGGVGLFTRRSGFTPVRPGRALALVVADSGPRPPTGEMVEQVRERCLRDYAAYAAFERLGQLPALGQRALSEGDLAGLGDLMVEARRHLQALGLETPALAALTEAALGAGALGAKLTGAGGGGCIVAACLLETAAAVEAALSAARWAHTFVLQPEPAP